MSLPTNVLKVTGLEFLLPSAISHDEALHHEALVETSPDSDPIAEFPRQ